MNRSKTAISLQALVRDLFAEVEPHVKNWPGFVRILTNDLGDWISRWDLETEVVSLDRGVFDGAEQLYDEGPKDITGFFKVVVRTRIDTNLFPMKLVRLYMPHIQARWPFMEAVRTVLEDQNKSRIFRKILTSTYPTLLTADPEAVFTDFNDRLLEEIQEGLGRTFSDVSFSIQELETKRAVVKDTGRELHLICAGDLEVSVKAVTFPEDYDE